MGLDVTKLQATGIQLDAVIAAWQALLDGTLKGDAGRGISNITKSGETVTVTYTDDTSDTFTVPNGATGNGISSISKSGETLTVNYTNGTTTTFTVPNGATGRGISSITQNADDPSSATVTYTDNTTSELSLPQGEKGDPFTYSDFTSEQLAGLVQGVLDAVESTSGFVTAETAQGYADTAETNANAYTDDQIAAEVERVDAALDEKQDAIPANTYDAYGAADTAESNANNYTDTEIAAEVARADAAYATAAQGAKADSAIQTETDPTVPAWAKAQTKPTYTATEVGADASGSAAAVQSNLNSVTAKIPSEASATNQLADKAYVDNAIDAIPVPDVSAQIATHNASENAHADLFAELSDRLNAIADSDDTTLDQLSEIVAYIKNNKSLIDGITTSKVNVSDIINTLSSDATSKPLSAAQGKALKALIDALTSSKYEKPSTGIPKTDLTSAVQTSLGKADNSVQSVSGKGLSTNDYDATAKAKVDAIPTNPKYTDTTYSDATTSASGLMSATDKTKLNGIATGANAYTHPTTSGNKHIPSGGSSGQILRWSADGTAVWGADNNTTYSVATTSANGLMSTSDKSKLDGIATGATANSASTSSPLMDGTASAGSAVAYARGDHRHPTDTGRAPAGVVTTGTPNTNTLIKINTSATPKRMPEYLYGTAVTGAGQGISATVTGAQAGDMYINSNTGAIYKARLNGSTLVWDCVYTPSDDAAEMIASAWSSATTYTSGDYCRDEGKLWKAKQQNTNSKPVEGANWTQVNVGDDRFRMVKLWENASPTSAFAAQEIPLDLSQYDTIKIEFIQGGINDSWYGYAGHVTYAVSMDASDRYIIPSRVANDGDGVLVYSGRSISVNTDAVKFSHGEYGYGGAWVESNYVFRPYRIWGIKGA